MGYRLKQKHIFITGGTGFIGSRLVKRLLKDHPDIRLTLLVYPKDQHKAYALSRQISKIYADPPVNWVLGDITQPRMGLTQAYYDYLIKTVHEVIHLAALYHLDASAELAWRVNYQGSETLVDFSLHAEQLKKFHHFSSLVAGKMRYDPNCTLENTQITYTGKKSHPKRPFLNHYERTKYLSEVLIRENLKDPIECLNIFRPGVVIGDSRTGYTDKFDGFYYLLLFLYHNRQYLNHLPLKVMGKSENFPIIPVDYVVKAASHICGQNFKGTRILPMAPEKPIQWQRLYDLTFSSIIGKQPKFKVTTRSARFLAKNSKVRNLISFPNNALGFIDHEIPYDLRPSQQALSALNLSTPDLEDYLEPVISFFLNHVESFENFLPQKDLETYTQLKPATL